MKFRLLTRTSLDWILLRIWRENSAIPLILLLINGISCDRVEGLYIFMHLGKSCYRGNLCKVIVLPGYMSC